MLTQLQLKVSDFADVLFAIPTYHLHLHFHYIQANVSEQEGHAEDKKDI